VASVTLDYRFTITLIKNISQRENTMPKLLLLLLTVIAMPVIAKGNIEAGKQKAVVCAACHGPDGNSTNSLWPKLAGQHQDYIVKQLKEYKEGKKRNAPEMTGMVAGLSEQDMHDLAAFYASQKRVKGSASKTNLELGERLYRAGDFKSRITACIACHGPDGRGNALAGFPALYGQQKQYIINQLISFKEGKRSNDLNSIMQDIASRMNKKQIEAVANYISGLH
jgi:cytochrome c553